MPNSNPVQPQVSGNGHKHAVQRSELSDILTAPVKRSLSDEIVIRLRDAILNGLLAPGERLREESIATSMNVSRGPVREAFQKLEREGLVIVTPNRGAVVARLSREDLDEVYSLRRALERLAVMEAVKNATQKDLDDMAEIVAEMAEWLARDISEQQAAELDTRFHQVLLESTQHKRLLRCWMDLRPQIHLVLLSRTVADQDFRQHLVKGHTDILNTIRDRDEQRAIEVIEDHIKGSYVRVVRSYKS